MGVSLRMLISEAYGIYDSKRIVDGPVWINSDKYDIEAKVDEADVAVLSSLNKDQRRAMLKTVLADRFKLVVHIEERSFPIYELILAKNGPKLHNSASEETDSDSKSRMPHVTRSRNGQLTVEWFTMADLARSLSLTLSRPVVDKTGLTDHYDFSLDWTPDDGGIAKSSRNPEQSTSSSPVESSPSIFTALPEQLGLKLEAVKGAVGFLVIDHAERPSSN